MRWQVTVAGGEADGAVDVAIDADPDTPVADVVAALEGVVAGPFWLDGRPFSGDGRLGSSGLRGGAVLHSAAAVAIPPAAGAPWQLAVAAGPDAGTTVALGRQEVVIGRDPGAGLPLTDRASSWHHARVVPAGGEGGARWMVEDLGSTNGTWVKGAPVAGPTAVGEGVPFEVGASLIEVRRPLPPDADVRADDDGALAFNRPARIEPVADRPMVQVPDPPSDVEAVPLPWVQALLPVLLAGLLFLLVRSTTMLLFAAFSPVLFISGTVGGHRRQARKRQRDLAAYEAALAAAAEELAAAAAVEADMKQRRGGLAPALEILTRSHGGRYCRAVTAAARPDTRHSVMLPAPG